MAQDITSRIETTYRKDVIFALGFVGVLWLVVLFVLFSIGSHVGGGGIQMVLIVSAALVLLFNTAAIIAMVRHYAHDKDAIYRIDIMHYDEMQAAKRKGN
ncbi:hypothetical protein [Roseovarius sp.]|uniref:hypothetical protein n=1 Tax=Roseovarius sp. TaxID=1486281 RepID=UPI003A986DEE